MRSVMTHQFSQIPKVNIERSSFDRSHGHKTTFDAGYLVPFYVDEALPGDTFNLRANGFGRLATPLKPFMDNLICDVFYFAVPNRLLWTHWKNFMGEKANPTDSTVYNVPYVLTPAHTPGNLWDYMGIPAVTGLRVNALHSRAYNLIWNEWFRDQNLQNSVTVDTGDGPDSAASYVLLKRGKRHDYFTSCLPWPQKGADVTLPLGTKANIITNATDLVTGAQNPMKMRDAAAGADPTGGLFTTVGASNQFKQATGTATQTGNGLYPTNLYADLTNATAATINALRSAFQLQKMYERDARGGTRYTEIVRSHFGVISPDARQQRPEYLGGGSTFINVHPVPQTAQTIATPDATNTPQGNLAGFGTFSFNNIGFTKSFTEHCVIIGLICVRADLTYQQGLDRMWSRVTRYDYYWPSLSHLGEQAVLEKEIYADGSGTDAATFGYQERYAEYRYKPSKITGLFRSGISGTLDYWHLAQSFASAPSLGATFIEEDPPIDRVIAVPTEPHFIFDSYIGLKCARPMPVYSIPGLIDHF